MVQSRQFTIRTTAKEYTVADETTVQGAAGATDASGAAEVERAVVRPNIVHVLVVALAVGVFAVVWLAVYSRGDDLIWNNPFVTANRWVIPVGVIFFSLLVGLAQKFLHAPNVVNGGIDEALKAEDVATYKTFWGTLASSLLSLWSGASVGPEGPLGFLAVQISQWIAARLKFGKQGALLASIVGMSSAYNGVVGNPVFATLLATEASGAKNGMLLVGPSLVGGTVGFLLFALLGVPPFANFLNVGTVTDLSLGLVAWALVLGLVGALLAVYAALAFRLLGRVMAVFKDRVIERALVAGIIIGVVCYFIPNLMFSGETEIHGIIADPAAIGLPMLLLMALLKPLLLALSLKSGYLGGPIFPALFSATMLGLAVSLLMPGVPLAVLVMCPAAGVITLLLRAPLTAILLITVMVGAGATPVMIGLITVAAAAALGVGMVLQRAQARRAAPAQPAAAAA